EASPRLAAVVDSLANGTFSRDDPDRFVPIVHSLCEYDRFMVAADFDAYWKAQREVDALCRSPATSCPPPILHTPLLSWFSADRAIGDYAREVWHVPVG